MGWDDPMLWATLSAAVATLVAATVALFLRELRAWLRPPKLDVNLSRENGLAVTSHIYPPGQALPLNYRTEKSRYYHLRVSNPRRKADSVNNVVMTLLRLERKGGDGQHHEQWTGDVPFQWRNEIPGESRRVVGTRAEADLCHVLRGKWPMLAIEKIIPNDLVVCYRIEGEHAITLPIDLAVTVQARGNEVDSEVQRWRIYWDGQWEDGDIEMRKHFHVTPLPVPSEWLAS
jgi:hypothetical protein